MSLTSPRLTPLPDNLGRPLTVEQLPGGKRRVVRRWICPAEVVTVADLAATGALEAYGTADAGFAGTGARGVDSARVYPSALLVEARVVPRTVPGSRAEEGDAVTRILEKVYEETPYFRSEDTDIETVGGVSYASTETVYAEGQTLPTGTVGTAVRAEFGRRIVRTTVAIVPGTPTEIARYVDTREMGCLVSTTVRAVGGAIAGAGTLVRSGSTAAKGFSIYERETVVAAGRTTTGYDEDGDGVLIESGREYHATEPADPAAGAYASWTKTALDGRWETRWTRAADSGLQPAAGSRTRRTRTAREDGSVVERVEESGMNPACATSLTGGTVILTGDGEVQRQGSIVARVKHWLKLPAERTQGVTVPWTVPGVVGVGGTVGTGGDAHLVIHPPVEAVFAGTATITVGTALTPHTPWSATAWASWYVGGEASDGSFSDVGSQPGCLADFSLSLTSGKWCGREVVSVAGVGSSNPASAPSGEIVAASRVEPYAQDLATGTIYLRRETVRITL